MESHKAELPGMSRHAGHGDGPGMEERCKALENVTRGARGGFRGSGFREFDQCIHGNGPPLVDDQWVDIHTHNVGTLDGQSSQPRQQGHESVLVHGGLTTERLAQKMMGPQPAQHAPRGSLTQRCSREHDVSQGFGKNTPEPQHHTRAELRVANKPRNQFKPTPHLFGNQHAHLAILGPGQRQQLRGGGFGIRRIRHTQAYQSPLGLVSDPVATEFDDHGKAKFLGRACGFRGIGGPLFPRAIEPVTGQQSFGVALGKRGGGSIFRPHERRAA